MKERLDVILVNRNSSRVQREGKGAIIMVGNVFVEGQRRISPEAAFRDARIEIKGEKPQICQPWRTKAGKKRWMYFRLI